MGTSSKRFAATLLEIQSSTRSIFSVILRHGQWVYYFDISTSLVVILWISLISKGSNKIKKTVTILIGNRLWFFKIVYIEMTGEPAIFPFHQNLAYGKRKNFASKAC